jgi:choline monooxygenase
VATLDQLPEPGDLLPVTLLPGVVDEPILLVRTGEETVRALANVCTHRGAVLVETPGKAAQLRCPYHGRRYALDGRLLHAPEMEGCPGFPTDADNLPEVAVGIWGPLVFVSVHPSAPFESFIAPVRQYAPWSPSRAATPERATYGVAAHWALWCDNYLEGLHVPWVHPGLVRELDWRAYRTEALPLGVLQVGLAPAGATPLPLPEGHPFVGERSAGLYLHLFPCTTLNFYPWGLSVNIVTPRAWDRTDVLYQAWVRDPTLRGAGAGGALDTVELEDDAIVERAQRGVRSRFYQGGRYVPGWEDGVRRFHAWIREVSAG